jgi:hypothetical protein
MQAEDRPIHFSLELIHGPCEHPKPVLQKLYFDLSQTPGASYDSTDFSSPGQMRFYSKRGNKSQSVAVFLRDRMVIIEEWVDIPLSSFLTKARTVADQAMEALNIQQIMAHAFTIRTTFALSHFEDARVFLLECVCNQEGRIGPHFQRPIGTGGLKFTMPETPDHPGNLNVTIESFARSRDELFVEVKAVFGRDRVARDALDTVCDNARGVRSFVSDRIFPYMNQFDIPQDLQT